MKILFYFILSSVILFQLKAFAQIEFSPTIIATSPNEIVAEESIKAELSDYNRTFEITDEIRDQYVGANLSENWKIIRSKELDYLKQQTFFSQLPFILTTNLTYKIYDYHENPLVYPVINQVANDRVALKAMAKSFQVDWIINVLSMEAKTVDGVKIVEARIILYNLITDRIFLDKTYIKEPVNPGGQLECEEGSWQCALNSIVEEAVFDIFDKLEKNRRYWSTDG